MKIQEQMIIKVEAKTEPVQQIVKETKLKLGVQDEVEIKKEMKFLSQKSLQ